MSVRPLCTASLEMRRALVTLARRYHSAGWMLGTSGNLSARFLAPEGPALVITASGLDKGALDDEDFVEVTLNGELIGRGPQRRPSAETSIHTAIYSASPQTSVALHVHTVASTELGRRHGSDAPIQLEDLEMLKGWGMWEADARALLPVFNNHAEVPLIASELGAWLTTVPSQSGEPAPAMLIAGHGLTAWGTSFEEAHRHVEITEFLCRVQLTRLPAEVAGA